ncbi:LPS-assembly protein LptD [candidate division FCPU426 bacterium]|nr:LPS-assembly protein LptD [candidate division FCPU426 bacterium]
MHRHIPRKTGVLFFRAPVFLLLLAVCGPAAAQQLKPDSSATAVEAGTATATAQQEKATLFADRFQYQEADSRLHAAGHVRVWYGQLTLTAKEAETDLVTNMVYARGDVVLVEKDRRIQCAEMEYNLKDRSTLMRGILFATHPWYYQGESVEKQGEKNVTISQARFTTCNARHPHYHLTAKQIDIVLNESLTAHHAVVYVGTTPLFYLPWFRRSLKDKRPPFSVRVGYNDFEGFFVKLRFNYYLWEENYGAVLLDFMEKKGVGAGLEQHVQYALLGKGVGDFSVWYVKDEELDAERWTANLANRHEFSEKDLLQLNAEYLSDHYFNREFSYDLVDAFQQKSYLSYSHREDTYFLSVGVNNVESLDPYTNQYATASRELPNAGFSLYSRRVAHILQPIYFSMNASYSRPYTRLGPAEDRRIRYNDFLNCTPSFTQTYTLPLWVLTQPSISGSLSFPVNAVYREGHDPDFGPDAGIPPTEYSGAYSTLVTLTNKWVNYRYTKPTHLLQTRLSHEFARKWPLGGERILPRAGVTGNRIGLGADYFLGDFFSLQGNSGYHLLLQDETDEWRERMDPLSFNGRASLGSFLSLNWQGQHDWIRERITSAYVSSSSYGKNWNISLSGSYSYVGVLEQDHSLFGVLSGGYKPAWGIGLNSSLQYDFVKQEFTNFSINLSRDLHCWEMQAGFKIYADGNLELGFGINLKAFPEIKVGMGGPSGLSVGE